MWSFPCTHCQTCLALNLFLFFSFWCKETMKYVIVHDLLFLILLQEAWYSFINTEKCIWVVRVLYRSNLNTYELHTDLYVNLMLTEGWLEQQAYNTHQQHLESSRSAQMSLLGFLSDKVQAWRIRWSALNQDAGCSAVSLGGLFSLGTIGGKKDTPNKTLCWHRP